MRNKTRPIRWLASLLLAVAFLVSLAPTTVGGSTSYVIVSGDSDLLDWPEQEPPVVTPETRPDQRRVLTRGEVSWRYRSQSVARVPRLDNEHGDSPVVLGAWFGYEFHAGAHHPVVARLEVVDS